jgi:tetratricopeptide (TPR) repeat protein
MYKLLVLLFLLACASSLQGQNLFDEQNTLKYARYLYQRGNYELAIPEFERLVYFNPSRESYKLHLLNTYFQTQEYDQIKTSIDRWFTPQVDPPFSLFYLKALLRQENYEEAQGILSPESRFLFPEENRSAYQLVSYGLSGQWEQSARICRESALPNPTASFEEYCRIVSTAAQFKEKNPYVAAGLSTLVPGLGKVYTRDYADAAVNILFIGLTAFQAYRGFTDDSIRDLQGWIYGGVALSFYLGNIYGSWRAADQYNYRYYESKRKALDDSFFRNERYRGGIAEP